MGIFLVYMLKSAVCLAVFYLFYKLLMSRDTFHRFNRFALLGLMALSSLLPLVEVNINEPVPVQETMLTLEQLLLLAEAGGADGEVMAVQTVTACWIQMALWVYMAGIVFFVSCNLWALYRLVVLLRRGRLEKVEDYLPNRGEGVVLIVHERAIAPFSWMRYIVISRIDLEESGREILIHELAHIRNGHSWDVLLADVLIFVQWFNPAAWLLKQELQNIHEYEADETVLREGVDARNYQMLLIKKAVGARLYSIANSLNHSSLKKRITMMMRKKSNPWARAKYLYVLPLAAVAVVAFARPEISEPLDEISKVKVNDLAVIAEVNPVKSVETEIPVTKVKVSGTVCDGETKEPVKGAAVLVKGGTLGTVTDADGKFMLMDVPVQAVLQVSMIGMETADIILGDSPEQTGIQVYLKKDGLKASDSDKELVLRGQMEELSVIGYSSSSDEPAGKGCKEKKPVSVQDAFMVVENMPEFPGGMRACMEFLARNIKYPVECQKNGVQGRVIVQFIVKADGSVDSPEIMRSVDPLLDAEALRVVGLMPKWKPGTQKGEAVDVRFTIPIAFQIPADNREDTVTGSIESGDKSKKNVLVIVDGAVLEGGMSELKTINPETIEFVEVIKDQSRLPEYNAQGKEGVILITTNKKQ